MNVTRGPIVVMYHYVRESRETSPAGIRPLFTNEFEAQLDWLEDNFQIVSAEEFLFRVAYGVESSRKPPCLLTFDDGTRDHLEVVAPILRGRSMPALFFVLTWPSELQRMPATHALHWILAQPEEEVWAKLKNFAEERLGGIHSLGSFEDAMKLYHYETGLRGRIKYAVNFALPPEVAEEMIAEFVAAKGKTSKELTNEWFLSEEEIKQLQSFGMEIGIHGCSHRSLAQLGPKGMADEIRYSSSYLKDLLGKAPAWLCCPFNGAGLKEDVAIIHQACREVNIRANVTGRKAFVAPETDLYDIPRYDCIDLPPRSSEPIGNTA